MDINLITGAAFVGVAAVGVGICWAMRTAPEAYQDADGFKLGLPPGHGEFAVSQESVTLPHLITPANSNEPQRELIDWTQPLEHVDGTPLVFAYPNDPTDEDGKAWTHDQHPGAAPSLIVDTTGRWWGDDHNPTAPQMIRNRRLRLTDDQRRVLNRMCADIGVTALKISEHTALPLQRVRVAQRQLRDMGLASLQPLYDEDDGLFRGTGYLLTSAGLDAQVTMRADAREQLRGIVANDAPRCSVTGQPLTARERFEAQCG